MNFFPCVAYESPFHGFCEILEAGLSKEERAASGMLTALSGI